MHRAARDVRMYERHFDLTDRPFGATPDPDFYFDSKGHARALAFLRYAIAQGDGLVVMTGGSGTGKTTLVHKILGELDPKAIAWAHLVSSQLDVSGSAGATVKGTVINLDDTGVNLTGTADIVIASTGTTNYPAGVVFGTHFAPLPDTYQEGQ